MDSFKKKRRRLRVGQLLFKHISLGDVFAFIADYFANGSNAYQKATCYLSWRVPPCRALTHSPKSCFGLTPPLFITHPRVVNSRSDSLSFLSSLPRFYLVKQVTHSVRARLHSWRLDIAVVVVVLPSLQQLLRAQRHAPTVSRHAFVERVSNARLVELRDCRVHRLRTANKRAEGQLVVRALLLNLVNLLLVAPINTQQHEATLF